MDRFGIDMITMDMIQIEGVPCWKVLGLRFRSIALLVESSGIRSFPFQGCIN